MMATEATTDGDTQITNNPKKHKTKTKTKKKSKKARKDKWGQPLLLEDEAVEEEESLPVPPQEEEAGLLVSGGEGKEEQEERYEATKVVASGLPYSTTEVEIRELFEQFGAVQALQLSRFPDSGSFRGLAFITFQTEEDAVKSLKLDGYKLGNRFMRVERCRITSGNRKRKAEFQNGPKKTDGYLSAYVGNVAPDVTEKEICDFFEESKICSVRFTSDKKSGASRRFCHVDFEDDESLEKAVQKNQFELHGRQLKIAYALKNRN